MLYRVHQIIVKLGAQFAQTAADVGKLLFLGRRQRHARELEITQRQFHRRLLRLRKIRKRRAVFQLFKRAVQPRMLAVPSPIFAAFGLGRFKRAAQAVGAVHAHQMLGDAPGVFQIGRDVFQRQVKVFPSDVGQAAQSFHRLTVFFQQKIHRRIDVFGLDGGKVGQTAEC